MDADFPMFDELGLDANEVALFEFFARLRLAQRKAEAEFADALKAFAEWGALRETLKREWEAMTEDACGGIRLQTPGYSMGEIREKSALLRAECSAGAIVLLLDDAFQRLRMAVKNPDGSEVKKADFTLAPLPGGAYLSTLLYAAGNALRHTKDWQGGVLRENGVVDEQHKGYGHARVSFAILGPAIGLDSVFEERACITSLVVMSALSNGAPDFELLWSRAEEAGCDFAQTYCDGPGSLERVRDTTEQQDILTAFEVSYTMDDRPFGDPDDET